MGILNKLFGNKTPDNTKLLKLIDAYWKANGGGQTYGNVISELTRGNSFLMLPTKNDLGEGFKDWQKTDQKITLLITSIVDVDGIKALGAFTDEQALLKWTKQASRQSSMRSQDVLKLCAQNGVDRIVINSGQSNMFVLENERYRPEEYSIEKNTALLIGTPNNPLSAIAIKKLVDNFQKVDIINEVYQYGLTKNKEFSIVLGFCLQTDSNKGEKQVIDTVQNALQYETLSQTLDLHFIKDQEDLDRIKWVENSLIYKKSALPDTKDI
jgi:hypothetical protein